MAKSVFDGTWRPDPQRFGPTRKPDIFELANGVYDCQSCTPPYKVKADGLDQRVAGNPYYDTISITIIDDRTLAKTAKKGGKPVMESKVVVSADSATQTERQTMYDMSPRPIEMTGRYTRVSAGPPGSHRISGAWRLTEADVSNHAEDTIFEINGNTLSMSDVMGRSFLAKLDGADAVYKGSDEFSSVSAKLIDSRTIDESDKKAGKVVKITRWSIEPDGKTMHARFDDTQGHVQEQIGHKVQ
jgi:hypothetical protein